MSAADVVSEIRKEAAAQSAQASATLAEAERVRALGERFPDLRVEHGRWGKKVFASPAANVIADDFETRHNCGCCRDSPLELWPFVRTELGPVHSSPSRFMIGEMSDDGDVPYGGWESDLRSHGIPEALIARAASLFPVPEEDEE